MKLISFFTNDNTDIRPGLVQQEQVVDLVKAGKILDRTLPGSILELIENYANYQQSLQAINEQTNKLQEASYPLAKVSLAAPLPRPRKNIMCIGINYSEHAKETAAIRQRSAEPPTAPVIFTKAPTAVNGPYGEIVIDPAVSTEIDWEVELGVIIGKTGKNIREEDAMHYVFGYTVINDVTARDLQATHKQFFKGKSLDGSCPMGPWIVTADEIADPHNLTISLRVNGVTKQHSNTSQMIFKTAKLIEVLSRGMTLEAGDIIATGTPSGVGFSRQPAEFLQPGDVMESEVEQVGLICNTVVGIK